MKHYHYIFAGAGLAALMTVYKMVQSGKFKDKTILLIDENAKKTNDRTWCFWEKPNHDFEEIVFKKWNFALFANKKVKRNFDLKPYQYNMIRGLDFYDLIFELITKQENITFINEKVLDFIENENHVTVITENGKYNSDKLFNSIYNKTEVENQLKYPVLQQHFIGWFIKSEQEVFTPEQVTFMDFSINQNGNTKFMYVLPMSSTEALLEPTLFSHKHLKKEEYEAEIRNYVQKLGIKNYDIVDKEQGSIPMTSYPFWEKNTKNILNIGTAGGWTKASTGFTFKHTNKKATALITFLKTETDFTKFHRKTKFWLYDLLFLDVLDKNNELGAELFSSLFATGNPNLIFKFLDEETSYLEDLQVILKCPKGPFLKAVFRRIFSF
jgi:lycopene cyclase-like protein